MNFMRLSLQWTTGFADPRGDETASIFSQRNSRSLHYAPPDFLSRLVASSNFMRLSLRKAANVVVGECHVAGNPGTLRSEAVTLLIFTLFGST
jgi:hypothetical protein